MFPSQLGGKEVAGKCGQEPLCGFHDEECSGRAEQGGAAESEQDQQALERKRSPESSDTWPWCVRGYL